MIHIIDLPPVHDQLYHVCLEDWSDEMKDAGDRKARWHEYMSAKGLRVKLAVDEHGEPGGMIQYLPAEESFIDGTDLYMILCIWVHGHKEGRGDFRRRGMGKGLLLAAEDDARMSGAKGMAAWGLMIPVWMKASWYRRHGYRNADRIGMRQLVWKPFTADAVPPRWIRERKRPAPAPGTFSVDAFISGWCPAMNLTYERAKRAMRELGAEEHFHEVDTMQREAFLDCGIADGVFLNGKPLQSGPPPSYEKIRRKISRKVKAAGTRQRV